MVYLGEVVKMRKGRPYPRRWGDESNKFLVREGEGGEKLARVKLG